MNSPKPVRRFSRWQTRKRTFVFGGSAFTTEKTSYKKFVKNNDQLSIQDRSIDSDHHEEEVPSKSSKENNAPVDVISNTSLNISCTEKQHNTVEKSPARVSNLVSLSGEQNISKHDTIKRKTFESIARSAIEETESNEKNSSSIKSQVTKDPNTHEADKEKENDGSLLLSRKSSSVTDNISREKVVDVELGPTKGKDPPPSRLSLSLSAKEKKNVVTSKEGAKDKDNSDNATDQGSTADGAEELHSKQTVNDCNHLNEDGNENAAEKRIYSPNKKTSSSTSKNESSAVFNPSSGLETVKQSGAERETSKKKTVLSEKAKNTTALSVEPEQRSKLSSKSFDLSVNKVDEQSGNRSLRNRSSIRKPPPNTLYPLEFLSSSQKRLSSSANARRSLFNNTSIRNGRSHHENESNQRSLQESNAQNSEVISNSKKNDGEALRSKVSSSKPGNKDKKAALIKNNKSFTEKDNWTVSTQLSNKDKSIISSVDVDISNTTSKKSSREARQRETSFADKDTSKVSTALSKKSFASENHLGDSDNSKVSETSHTDEEISEVISATKKSDDNDKDVVQSKVSNKNGIVYKKAIRRRMENNKSKDDFSDTSNSKAPTSHNDLETDYSAKEISDLNSSLQTSSTTGNLQRVSNHSADANMDIRSTQKATKKSKMKKETNKSHRLSSKKDKNITSSPEQENEADKLNQSRSLRKRNSIRKPPPTHYPVEFLSSNQKRSLSMSTSKKNSSNSSLSTTTRNLDKSKSNSLQKSTVEESPSPNSKNTEEQNLKLQTSRSKHKNKSYDKQLKRSERNVSSVSKDKFTISRHDLSRRSNVDKLESDKIPSDNCSADDGIDDDPIGSCTESTSLHSSKVIQKVGRDKPSANKVAKQKTLVTNSNVVVNLKTVDSNIQEEAKSKSHRGNNTMTKLKDPQDAKKSEKEGNSKAIVPSLEKEKNDRTAVERTNDEEIPISMNESASNDVSENKSKSLRNRSSIRKPPTNHYPIEFLSSHQLKVMKLLPKKTVDGGNKKDQTQSKKGKRKAVEKRRYSLPRKKSKTRLLEPPVIKASNVAVDSIDHTSQSLVIVDTLRNTNRHFNPHKDDRDVHSVESAGIETSDAPELPLSQPLDDTVRGATFRMRRKRRLVSDFNSQQSESDSTMGRKDDHTIQADESNSDMQRSINRSAGNDGPPNKKPKSKTAINKITRKSLKSKSESNRSNARKPETAGRKTIVNEAKLRPGKHEKPKEMIREWMSSYQLFLRQMAEISGRDRE